MNSMSEKVRYTVEQKRVKLHVFEPSNHQVWTVVGTGQEYWVDPKLEFCSCAGFYFSRLNGKEGCYHLESLKIAISQQQYDTIKFSDDEYDDFVASLITEL